MAACSVSSFYLRTICIFRTLTKIMFLGVKFCVISGKLSWSASGVLIYLKINYLSAAPCTELGPCIGGRTGGGEGSTGSGSGLSGLRAHGAVYQCHGGLRAGHTHTTAPALTMGRAPVTLAILLCLLGKTMVDSQKKS